MAEALRHRPRPAAARRRPTRTVPERFWEMVERRADGRAGRLHHRPPRLLGHRAPRRSRRAGAAARQRSPDRLGDRAFRRHCAGRRGSSISAPGPGRCCLPRSTSGRRRPGIGVDVSRSALDLCRRQCAPARVRAARRIQRWRLGRGHRRDVSTWSCATRPMSRRRRAWPGRARIRARRGACSPAATGSTPIARSPRSLPRLLDAGRPRGGRDRLRPGRAGSSTARPRRPYCDASPMTSAGRPRAVLLTSSDERNRLAYGARAHYIMAQGRARSTTKAEERIPSQPPTLSAVQSQRYCAQLGYERVRAAPWRGPARPMAKGL